ncbi:hypothetical protein GQ473_01205 [archaeon]|nr:hypothetical protein [archaeon]
MELIDKSDIFDTITDYLDVPRVYNWTELPEYIHHRIFEPLEILDVYNHPNASQYEFLLCGEKDENYQVLGSANINDFVTDTKLWRTTHNPKIGDKLQVILSPPCRNPYIDENDVNIIDNQGIIKQMAVNNPDILVAKIYYLEIIKE